MMSDVAKRRGPWRWLALAALVAAGANACSDGGDSASINPTGDEQPATPVDSDESATEDGDESGEPGESPSQPLVAFTSTFALDDPLVQDVTSEDAGLWLTMEPVAPNVIRVNINGRMESAFGLAFRIDYDPTYLELSATVALDLLSDALATGRYIWKESLPGELMYGGARIFPSGFNNFGYPGVKVENQVLAYAEFEVKVAGATRIDFQEADRDARGQNFQQLNPSWVGGELTIQTSGNGGSNAN